MAPRSHNIHSGCRHIQGERPRYCSGLTGASGHRLTGCHVDYQRRIRRTERPRNASTLRQARSQRAWLTVPSISAVTRSVLKKALKLSLLTKVNCRDKTMCSADTAAPKAATQKGADVDVLLALTFSEAAIFFQAAFGCSVTVSCQGVQAALVYAQHVAARATGYVSGATNAAGREGLNALETYASRSLQVCIF